MEFVHHSYEKGQTIAAIATPPGEGGIGVIRISGNQALEVANKIFSGPVAKYVSHTVHYGKVIAECGEVIDHVLLLVMRTPRSYTGEDTVEIHCHGGLLITKRVLNRAIEAGARMALPGEFSYKAFLNGKLDLTRAEAVQALIGAKNHQAMEMAKQHLEGALHDEIYAFQKELTELTAILEAWVDFPEEGLEFISKKEMLERLENLYEKMKTLQMTFHEGSRLKTGYSLCLLGAPNVGKSSLMNALTGKERAIVTNIPGTTRDLIEEEIVIDDLHFHLIDTAGIRETDEVIEQEGVRRSHEASSRADIILYVLDVHQKCAQWKHLPEDKTLFVWNKCDLPHEKPPFEGIEISATKREGLSLLKKRIREKVHMGHSLGKDEVVLTSERHFQSLNGALHAVECVCTGLREELSPEFLVSDMRCGLKELGTIIGTNVTEDVLNAIFSKFCVGK